MDQLKPLMAKVKIDGVNECVNHIFTQFNTLLKSRIELFVLIIKRNEEKKVSKEELLDAVSSNNDVYVKLVSPRTVYDGSKKSVVIFSAVIARRLCAVGRLRVGFVYTRVRPIVLPQRYFKCLAFSHNIRECSGLDRSNCYWRSGCTGHLRYDCTATRDRAKAFMATLTSASVPSDAKLDHGSQESNCPDASKDQPQDD